MREQWNQLDPADDGDASASTIAPGKRTLTMAVPARAGVWRAPDAGAAVAGAISDSGAPLPYLDTVQHQFGHHDVSGVRAHTGAAVDDAARVLGASAFATG